MHWATGSRPRAWAGLFTAEASFTAQIDFELFPFFFNLELEIRFYPHTNVPHVAARSTDSRPANERSPSIRENCNREDPQQSTSPCLNVTECHRLSNNYALTRNTKQIQPHIPRHTLCLVEKARVWCYVRCVGSKCSAFSLQFFESFADLIIEFRKLTVLNQHPSTRFQRARRLKVSLFCYSTIEFLIAQIED